MPARGAALLLINTQATLGESLIGTGDAEPSCAGGSSFPGASHRHCASSSLSPLPSALGTPVPPAPSVPSVSRAEVCALRSGGDFWVFLLCSCASSRPVCWQMPESSKNLGTGTPLRGGAGARPSSCPHLLPRHSRGLAIQPLTTLAFAPLPRLHSTCVYRIPTLE